MSDYRHILDRLPDEVPDEWTVTHHVITTFSTVEGTMPVEADYEEVGRIAHSAAECLDRRQFGLAGEVDEWVVNASPRTLAAATVYAALLVEMADGWREIKAGLPGPHRGLGGKGEISQDTIADAAGVSPMPIWNHYRDVLDVIDSEGIVGAGSEE